MSLRASIGPDWYRVNAPGWRGVAVTGTAALAVAPRIMRWHWSFNGGNPW